MAYAPSQNQSYIYSPQKSPMHKQNHNLSISLSSTIKLFLRSREYHNTMAGTEAFPDLGKHCQLPDCNQLDFLPFKCDGCEKVFCVEHRSYKSHECSNSDYNSRKVLVCETCSMSMEIPLNRKGGEDENVLILEKHRKSGDCDAKKKKKPTCGVRRCKEILTFSNTSTCRSCDVKFCLKHRFQSDHACKSHNSPAVAAAAGGGGGARPFLVALASRMGKDCTKKTGGSSSSASTTSTSVKAY